MQRVHWVCTPSFMGDMIGERYDSNVPIWELRVVNSQIDRWCPCLGIYSHWYLHQSACEEFSQCLLVLRLFKEFDTLDGVYLLSVFCGTHYVGSSNPLFVVWVLFAIVGQTVTNLPLVRVRMLGVRGYGTLNKVGTYVYKYISWIVYTSPKLAVHVLLEATCQMDCVNTVLCYGFLLWVWRGKDGSNLKKCGQDRATRHGSRWWCILMMRLVLCFNKMEVVVLSMWLLTL